MKTNLQFEQLRELALKTEPKYFDPTDDLKNKAREPRCRHQLRAVAAQNRAAVMTDVIDLTEEQPDLTDVIYALHEWALKRESDLCCAASGFTSTTVDELDWPE